ncbi:MAG: FecR domain-containing protein [Xanthobacteraceae bacterium]|nr:FecR domain-containing protein [Xanthobacteraceae bacterium]
MRVGPRAPRAIAAAVILLLGLSLPARAQDAAQPAPAAPAQPAAPQASAQPPGPAAANTPVGSIASVTGNATDFRNGAPVTTLKVNDGVLKGDLLQTDTNASLGVTFDDETTFQLGPSATLVVSDFLFEQGGSKNSAVFNVVRGSAAFVASLVAKTGDMKIVTPTATLGIRGTTGLIQVPTGGTGDVAIKLYPDANGRVGQIEVFGAGGARLGTLNRAATGFSIRSGPGGFAAVPLRISAQEAARDRAFVQQTFAAQRTGRQLINQRRNQQQPGQQRPPGPQRTPNAPGRQGQQPGRQGQQIQQPGRQGQANRPGQQATPGQPNRRGQQNTQARPNQAGQPNQQGGANQQQGQQNAQPGQQNAQGQPNPQNQPALQGQGGQRRAAQPRPPAPRKAVAPKPGQRKQNN